MILSKPQIFISYSHSDKSLVETIESDISIAGYEIIRDERKLKYTGNIELFIKSIRSCNLALIIVSDLFLKSVACMSEMSEFLKDESAFERILPIVIVNYEIDGKKKKGADIYTITGLTNYVAFWEKQEARLRKQLTKIDVSNYSNLTQELTKIIKIENLIGDFIFLLRKIKHTNQVKLKASNYKELLERLGFENTTLDDLNLSANYFGRAMSEIKPLKRIAHLQKSIELNPINEKAYDQKARALDNLGKYEQAIDSYNIAITLNPTQASYYVNRSYSYIRMGKFELALNDANKSIELNPKERMSYNNRADIYRRLGKYEMAIHDIEAALKIEPTFDLAYATLAEVYAAQGKKNEFFYNLKKSVELGFPLMKYSFDDVYKEFEKEDEFKSLIELSRENDRII